MSFDRFAGEGTALNAQRWSVAMATEAGCLMVCPLATTVGTAGMAELYRIAYERARAMTRPSWYERALAASLN